MLTVAQAIDADRMTLTGDRQLAKDIPVWLGLRSVAERNKATASRDATPIAWMMLLVKKVGLAEWKCHSVFWNEYGRHRLSAIVSDDGRCDPRLVEVSGRFALNLAHALGITSLVLADHTEPVG